MVGAGGRINQEPQDLMNALPQWLTPTSSPHSTKPGDEVDIDPDNPDAVKRAITLRRENNKLVKQLEEQTFEAVFDDVLEHIASGQPLTAFVESRPLPFDYQRCLSWIMRDETRKLRYYEAQETGAEIVSHQILGIADADDSIEDVARSTLRINSRKWLMGVWSRKRFGEIKQIDQNVTIDLSAAMREAQERLDSARTVDVLGRVVE